MVDCHTLHKGKVAILDWPSNRLTHLTEKSTKSKVNSVKLSLNLFLIAEMDFSTLN